MKSLTLLIFLIASVNAQISPNQAIEAWDRMSEMVVGSVKKMPAEHFSFSPIEPLASFAKLVNHTTGANYLFAATVKLERPKVSNDAVDKKTVVRNLEQSFAFIRTGLKNLSQDELNETIKWFGRDMTRLNAILTMTDHLQREYGKMITYLRLKKTAPGRSAGW